MEHIGTADLGPQVFHFTRFRKKSMATDVEVEAFVIGSARNSAHILRIAFKNYNRRLFLGKFVSSGQPRRASAHDHGFVRMSRQW